jgi:hypothetical protein
MTAKEFVKQKYPNARAERYTSGRIKLLQSHYYLIWTDYQSKNPSRLSEGTTESNAWVNAKKRILSND